MLPAFHPRGAIKLFCFSIVKKGCPAYSVTETFVFRLPLSIIETPVILRYVINGRTQHKRLPKN